MFILKPLTKISTPDALSYVDTDFGTGDPSRDTQEQQSLRQEVMGLIQQEMQAFKPSGKYLESMPAMPPVDFKVKHPPPRIRNDPRHHRASSLLESSRSSSRCDTLASVSPNHCLRVLLWGLV